MADEIVDVLIVGGGPAGLSCALTLARGGRTVALCDDGRPRNKQATVMNNFPGMDGISPSDFLQRIRRDLECYPEIQSYKLSVIDVRRKNKKFETVLNDGKIIISKKLILAEGLVDQLPDIPGIKEGWGRSVFQCPYCHAYEHKGQAMAILADQDTVFHTTTLLFGLSNDIKIFTNGKKFLNLDDKKILDSLNVEIFQEPVEALVMDNDQLKGVRLNDGRIIERNAIFIKPNTKVRSDFGVRLGCKLNENGTYDTDENCKSCVPGVYIAGDVSSKMHSVLLACAEGSKAGLNANLEILEEEFHKAVEPVLPANEVHEHY